MRHFVEILGKFTQNQRLLVLVILLTFTVGGFLVSQYLKTDDCRSLMKENLEMQKDFAQISEMLRRVTMQQQRQQQTITEVLPVDSSMAPALDSSPPKPSNSERRPASSDNPRPKPKPVEPERPLYMGLIDSIMAISEVHRNKIIF